MSIFAAAPMATDWPSFKLGQRPSNLGNDQETVGLGLGYSRIQTSTVEHRPPLRSHKSFPHTLRTSGYATPHCQSPLSQVADPGSMEDATTGIAATPKPPKPTPGELTIQTRFGGSAPTSPTQQLSPTSAATDHEENFEDEDDMIVMGEGDEQNSTCGVEKTAAERRAEKRKMKRFRLTHNQTRFLMSEFARQAHPDAAQRERLSREIPGLSPRQVQVWFQNRRAKLKRLTTDDRERMMKSRALPEDFDMTQALHSPFNSGMPQPFSTPSYSMPMASPSSYTPHYDSSMIRPLMVNGLRRESEDDSTISPASISSAFGSFYTPPGSVPTSENMSPVSPTSERASFMNTPFSQTSPRGSNPFANRSSSFSTNFHGHPNIPRLQLHERVNRSRAESLASPLRTSMSYTGSLEFVSSVSEDSMPTQATSLVQPARSYSIDQPSSLSQTSDFNYNPHGFQYSALARPRPTITTFPPGLDLRSSYRPLLAFSSLQTHHQQHQTQAQAQAQQQSHSSISSQSQHHGLPLEHNFNHQSQATTVSTYNSMAYASAPLAPPGDFQLPAAADLFSYGGHDEESLHGGGSTPQEAPIEPESYYKSETDSRRLSMSKRSSDQFSPQIQPQSHHHRPIQQQQQQIQQVQQQYQQKIQQQPQIQHSLYPHRSPQSPHTPLTAGVKRRRDSGTAGSDQGEGSLRTAESLGLGHNRRRSFTLPSGYGS